MCVRACVRASETEPIHLVLISKEIWLCGQNTLLKLTNISFVLGYEMGHSHDSGK